MQIQSDFDLLTDLRAEDGDAMPAEEEEEDDDEMEEVKEDGDATGM